MTVLRHALAAVAAAASLAGAATDARAQEDLSQVAQACEMKTEGLTYQAVADACTAVIEQARDLPPESLAAALAFRALARVEMQQTEAALRDIDRALALRPDDALFNFTRGRVHLQMGEAREAVQDLTRALSAAPGHWEILMYRAIAHDALDQEAEARRDHDAATAATDAPATAWFARGGFRYARKDLRGAIADLTRAYELEPQADGAVRVRGEVYLDLGDFDRAVADADLAARIAPTAINHNARCWSRAVANRDLETARAACDESLRLETDSPMVLDSRGLVGLRQGRFQDAWNDYDAAVRRDRQAGYLYGRGIAALRLGRRAEGQADIDAALALNPGVAAVYAERGVRP